MKSFMVDCSDDGRPDLHTNLVDLVEKAHTKYHENYLIKARLNNRQMKC